jgi:hypothetical protein
MDRRDEVGYLEQKPATERERCGHFSNRLRRLRQKRQHGARVYKVKFGFRKRLAQNVVRSDFQVRRVDGLKKTRLKIGRDDATVVADPVAKPFRYRAASTSFL